MIKIFQRLVFSIIFIMTAPKLALSDQLFTTDDVKRLALEAILENPEKIREALAKLDFIEAQAREERIRENLQQAWDEISSNNNAPVSDNPAADVTVVEFFDYNCPFCRRAKPEVEALKASDKKIRYVYREWPVLGEGSVFAARAALASIRQEKYEEFHWALMALEERAEETSVIKVAKEIGLDVERLRQDMDSSEVEQHIAQSMALANDLNITGTPTFVFRDKIIPGFVQAEVLLDEVVRVRQQRN